MELQTVAKCFILFFICHSGTAREVTLSPCAEVPTDSEGGSRHCVAFDSTTDTYRIGLNITAILTIELAKPILTECWNNINKIAIVTSSGLEITRGKEIKSKQEKGRWQLEPIFKQVNENYGKLHLELHIQNVTYRDSRLLHLEIRTETTTFTTGDKLWISIPSKTANGREAGHERNTSPGQNMSFEDPRANLQERVEVLNKEKLALQKELTAVLNNLTRSQAEHIHCLESKKNSVENQDVISRPNALDITESTLFFGGLLAIIILIAVFFIKYGIKMQPIDETSGTEFSQTQPHKGITLYYLQRCTPDSMPMV